MSVVRHKVQDGMTIRSGDQLGLQGSTTLPCGAKGRIEFAKGEFQKKDLSVVKQQAHT